MKKRKQTLSIIIILLIIISIVLITVLTLKNRKTETKTTVSETVTTTNEEVNQDNEEDITNTEEVIDENPEGISNINYQKDIKEVAKTAEKSLIINGEKFSIPCKFNDIKDKFDFIEQLPGLFEQDGYLLIHAKDKKDGHTLGIAFMLSSMQEGDYNLDDAYITGVNIHEGSTNICSCYGLKVGDSKKVLEKFIENHDWEYVTSDYDVETGYYFTINERMGFIVDFDNSIDEITKIMLDYIII